MAFSGADGRPGALGAQLELVVVIQVTLDGSALPPVCIFAADGLNADRGAAVATVTVRPVAGVRRIAGRTVDLKQAPNEGLEERRAGSDDADIELETNARRKQSALVSGVPLFMNCCFVARFLRTHFCQKCTQ